MPLKEVALAVATTVDESPRARPRSTPWSGARRRLGRHEHRRRAASCGRCDRTCRTPPTAPSSSAPVPRRARRCSRWPSSAPRRSPCARRDTAKAADLLAWALGHGIRSGSVAGIGPWVTTRDDVVVSTVPAAAGDAVAATVPAAHRGVLLDVVYAGWPTPVARAAAAAGMTVVSGLDMLVHQAAEQFRLFTGHEAPVAAMLAGRPSGAGGAVTPVVGRAPRGPRHGGRRPPHRPAARDRRLPHRRRTRPTTPPGRPWWPGPLTALLSALAAWAIGDLGSWAALPAYLLFAWLTVGLIWIDLDVHRLPVGLVVPPPPPGSRAARRRDGGDGGAALVGRAGRGGRHGRLYLVLGCCREAGSAAATCGSPRSSGGSSAG